MSMQDSNDPENEVNEDNTSLSDGQEAILEPDPEGDEVDDEAIVEGAAESSVQVAPTDNLNPALVEQDDPMLSIQLGDRILIDSKYGRIVGTVYYNDADRLSIKPDGLSNRVVDFETDENGFKEDDQVTNVGILKKRAFESFVEQQDFRVSAKIDTFDVDGQLFKAFDIIKVDKENDFIEIKDENGDVHTVVFNFIGIPSDESFKVISIRQPIGGEEKINEEQPIELRKGEEEGEEGAADAADAAEEEEDEIEVLGQIKVTKPKVIREASFYEQRIPDTIQKIDALNDFVSSIDATLQKDPKAIRAIRILVETLFDLKQSIIEYNEDGTVRSQKAVSAFSLSDLIDKTYVPMGRPVLAIDKKEYDVVEDLEEKEIEGVYFTDFEQELENIIQQKPDVVSSKMEGAADNKLNTFWTTTKNFLTKYVSPWYNPHDVPSVWKAYQDSELFRQSYPDKEAENTVPGYIATHSIKDPPIFDKVPFGIERALSTTYRKGIQRKKQLLIPEDTAVLQNYMLFPASLIPYIGSTRSSSIAVDSGRSQLTRKTMKTILTEWETPKVNGMSDDIILLGSKGQDIGNISIENYLEGVPIPALGIGDTFSVLEQYGLRDMELTEPIAHELTKKINRYQAQFVRTLNTLIEKVNQLEPKDPEPNPFLKNPAILEEIRSQPMLADALRDFERINISLSKSDVASAVYLLKEYPDYFQVAAGKDQLLIATAQLDANNKRYLDAQKVKSILNYNRLHAGQRPRRNTCKHVADLVAVRKIKDNSERFEKLIETFVHYQGVRDQNWINCNLCKEHLLCVHERLQIDAFLRPAEKLATEKEIILKFSGGQFNANYICRNCGQTIREIDFDNNIEFDDDGKPKSGRAVLVDEDALFTEKMNRMVGVPIESSDKKEMNLDDNKGAIYDMIRLVAEQAGIKKIEQDSYLFIINNVIRYLSSFPAEKAYAQAKLKNPKLPEYIEAKAIRTVSYVAMLLLIELQTRIPLYQIVAPLVGCESPGLDGYPLSDDINKVQGIEYLACVVSSIRRNQDPWNHTGYQRISSAVDRQKRIITNMIAVLKKMVEDVDIQDKLRHARSYLTNTFGVQSEKGRPKDVIPPTFLPEQIIITPEEAAKDAIKPEVAAVMRQDGTLVKLWIRHSHELARKTASLFRDSQYLNTTCCLTDVTTPNLFWSQVADLPDIGHRVLTPYRPAPFLMPTFVPRKVGSIVAEPDKNQYYRIFLKCCFKGPRIGHSHEPGLDNICTWCGFQFPMMPSIMETDEIATDRKKAESKSEQRISEQEERGKSSFVCQDVQIDSNTFTTLLDIIHTVNNVKRLPPVIGIPTEQIMTECSTIQPAPISNWEAILMETYRAFKSLPSDADQGDIAIAAGPISEEVARVKEYVQMQLRKSIDILDNIVHLSWANFFQVLQSYFITPFERKITDYDPNTLFVPYELKKALSAEHVSTSILPILDRELIIMKLDHDQFKQSQYSFARSKLRDCIKKLSMLLPFKHKINPRMIPQGERAFTYIQEAILYGILYSLLDPNVPAFDGQARLVSDPSDIMIHKIVNMSLSKFSKEFLTYDDKKIKELIEIANEKERTRIIDNYNKMSDERKAVELTKQRLRMGDWAIGGKIHSYDGEVWEIEQRQRREMGIVDFPDSDSYFGNVMGSAIDADGNPIPADADEEGYDHRQDNGED